jgi:hypothetical protein
MNKTPRKFVLRRQTLRVVVDLDLARTAGGLGSGHASCPAVLDTGAAACPTTVPAARTAAC